MLPRVLIVDDHDDFRKAVKLHLEGADLELEIYEASTAEMAVAKAACIKPVIVLMDINLPGANGFAALSEIKRDSPACDVIILSMFEAEAVRNMVKESQAKDFIGKSEVFECLVPALRKCLKNRDVGNHNNRKRRMAK